MKPTAEEKRLADTASGKADWQRWGTYVSDRAWGTVREDYSADGSAWEYFPHDHGETGEGAGANHQTGWTPLVALLLQFGGQLCFETLPLRPSAEEGSDAKRTAARKVLS